jgi:hypothetical protein
MILIIFFAAAPCVAQAADTKSEPPKAAASAAAAHAPDQKISSKEDAKRLFDETMNLLVTDRIEQAFALLKPNFPLEASEIEGIQQDIKKKRVLMKDRFGASIGFVYLGQDALSDVFARFIYVEKFERHAIRWVFVIYKPHNQWIVNAVSFDDKLDQHYKPVS